MVRKKRPHEYIYRGETAWKVWVLIARRVDSLGYPPTYREICAHFGWKSVRSAHYYVSKLDQAGVLRRWPNRARCVTLIKRPEM
jgi:repressor LexA